MSKRKKRKQNNSYKGPRVANRFDEQLMARIYDDKKDIKPLKKEEDAQIKRYVRDTEGNSSKKSNESQRQNKSTNDGKPKSPNTSVAQNSSAQNASIKQDVKINHPVKKKAEQEKTNKLEDRTKAEKSNNASEHNFAHPENKQKEKVRNEQPKIEPTKEDDFDDEETTFMGSEPSNQKYPFLENAATGERYYIYSVPFTIGKRSTCDLSINSKIVSREHAQIISDGQKYFAIDMESKNGTYINGYRIIPMNEIEIKNGQTIIFANEKYIFKKEE